MGGCGGCEGVGKGGGVSEGNETSAEKIDIGRVSTGRKSQSLNSGRAYLRGLD